MRKIFTLLLILLINGLQAQSIKELEEQLQKASSSREKMNINFELGEAWLRQDADKSIEYAKTAQQQSLSTRNNGMAAQSSFLVARGYNRLRGEEKKEETWLKSALKYAKLANDADLIIKSVDKLSRLVIKHKRDYRTAYQITEEAFNYFSENGKSISDLDRQYEKQKTALERERKELVRDMNALQGEINRLETDKSRLSKDNTSLTKQQRKLEQEKASLVEEKQMVEEEVAEKEKEIEVISRAELNAKYIANLRKTKIDSLETRQQMDSLVLRDAKLERKNAELLLERGKYVVLLLAGVSIFVVLLAFLYFLRYRANRKHSQQLEEQNSLIEMERQRSDELLLNILPASIAAELKEKGKATAHKYPEASILFSDFKNFTVFASKLTPEKLVEEIDTCFKEFDKIISKYDDIEKIKTIGDAYMCASGLVDRKTMPANLIRAALEMQRYLLIEKKAKQAVGQPYFEARIGIHTGPVVAGVVGTKKFAYDIWGDTVNIAARMETEGHIDKVNISETTYGLVKYNFDCQYRGKIHAKNKGMVDMYFVTNEKK